LAPLLDGRLLSFCGYFSLSFIAVLFFNSLYEVIETEIMSCFSMDTGLM
jgi:hypothetical protein